jgi:hypothetical protein
MFLALVPVLLLVGPGRGRILGITPMMSGWTAPTTLLASDEPYVNIGDKPDQISYIEAQELGDYIKSATEPHQTIHTFGNIQLASILAFHADRPIDTASWPEVRQPDTFSRVEEFALRDPSGCYVSRDKEQIPEDATVTKIGRFFIGIRQH